jgi:uncharacterized membrane protein (DUF4010 family)
VNEWQQMPWLGIAVAGGAGLLIGLERERRKRQPGHVAFAGVRTFTLAALAGAIAQAIGQPWMVVAGALLLGALITVAYIRSSVVDNGATTELALFVTYMIGVAAIAQPMLAAGVSVAVTALLASRTRLHAFANEVLSPDELRDGLILAASALIVLPLAPSTPLDWLGGLDLRQVWSVVVLLLAIQAGGHVALRVLGPRHGLAISGFASGFITSTGTIAAYGLRARQSPAQLDACAAGALLSCLSTFLQLGVLIVALHPPALAEALPMLAAGLLAVVAASLPGLLHGSSPPAGPAPRRRAFSLPGTVGFAMLLAGVTLATRWLDTALGAEASLVAIAIAGFADVHAASASALSLASSSGGAMPQLQLMLLLAISTNTASKLVASLAGGRRYALRVMPGLLLSAGAAWAASLATGGV